MRVVAIDPAIRTGYAVIDGDHHRPTVIVYETITTA